MLFWAFAGGCTCRDSSREAAPTVEAIYRLDEIPTFSLSIPSEGVDRLKVKKRKWVGATLEHNGTAFPVSVRLKGHRSMRPFDKKPSFKIRFDTKSGGSTFRGLSSIILNNMAEDPTMMREVFGYRLYREEGVPAPRAGYAELQVNGEHYGLYAFIEPLNSEFLVKNFADPSGGLYEGEYGCDLYPEDVAGFDRDSGTDEARDDLAAFAAATSGEPRKLFGESGPLDMPGFLGYLAVSAFLADFDGYRHSHNYRIYHEPTKAKWFFLPWGIDRVFKQSMSVYNSEGLLATRCFQDSRCRLEYVRKLHSVIEHFERLKLDEGIKVLQVVTQDAVARDTHREHSMEDVIAARKRLARFIKERPDEVRAETACIDDKGAEVDRDGDGFGCMDCDDANAAIHPGAVEMCGDAVDNDCSGMADDAPQCPCETVSIGGVTMHLCNRPMSWPAAEMFCKQQGLELARVDSPEQAKSLRAAANKLDKDRWWIGLSDRTTEGTFLWRDGSEIAFDNWPKGEPDNAACNQDCVALKEGKSGKWHDTHCGQYRPFVCREYTHSP